MSKDRFDQLDQLRESLKAPSELREEILWAIAERLEEAVSAPTRAPLETLDEQLIGLFDAMLRTASKAAVEAVRGSAQAGTAETDAYLLGQVSFAQLFAAQAAERRADDRFVETIRSSLYAPYVKALARDDYSGTQLAQICGERTETVSRKLKVLRDLGITDFQREGTSFVNFLTPAAQAVAAEFIEQPETEPAVRELPDLLLRELDKVAPHLRKPVNFASEAGSGASTLHRAGCH
jgi:DNA-binding transcriptional ArsR family regulator